MTNTELLTKAIDESGLKRYHLANRLGLTYPGLLKKINGETEFKASEIKLMCEALNLDKAMRERIFFA